MNSYNVKLRNLRLEKSLTLKELSKEVKISTLTLYLYERGYFRPTKKALTKLEEFYGESISLEGLDAYPEPILKEKEEKQSKDLFVKRVVFGVLTGLMLLFIITGVTLFNISMDNADTSYGETYISLKENVKKKGTQGHDIATGLEYYQINERDDDGTANIIFYKTDSIMYFNECSYSTSRADSEMGLSRVHYTFGGNLALESNVCTFSFGSTDTGSYFSCDFIFDNKPVTSVFNFQIYVQAGTPINDETAIKYINLDLGLVNTALSKLMSKVLETEVDFYKDFIPAREEGRIVNFSTQLIAIILLVLGIVFFFIFGAVFTTFMFINIKPRLINKVTLNEKEAKAPLPNDINMKVGIPDKFLNGFSILLILFAITFMVLSVVTTFLGILGYINPPKFLENKDFSFFLKVCLFSGSFLNFFVMLGSNKRPDSLIRQITFNLFLFLLIATIETATILVTDAWGYDLGSVIYQYIPGNVFQIIAAQYLIYLFLFFQPPFLNMSKKFVRYVWHGLSIIPLAFLVVSYIASNQYALIYGVEENVFISFWFSNNYLPLSIVSVLFMYSMFVINLLLERKYDIENAQIFVRGDRYTLIENGICSIYVLIVGLLDMLFINNQYGYYLGLGQNYWILALIPLIMLCKFSINQKQAVLIKDSLKEISREEVKVE